MAALAQRVRAEGIRGTCRHQFRMTSVKISRPVAAASANPSTAAQTAPKPEVLKTLREAQAVCFDVDSTFCEDEAIDELAAYLGVGKQVAELTAKAMGGSVDFRTALSTRLNVIKPSQQDFTNFMRDHPFRVSKGIPELLAVLRRRGQQVFLVSGGFRQTIHPLAASVGIPVDHVFANNILFDAEGKYAGFNENEFTSRSGGKPAAIKHIKEKWGFTNVVMVGDGATDAEARLEGEASLFIGYGGVAMRPTVAAKADWYIMDMQEFIHALSE
mmetsp:Transcript_5344/g.11688  ORF Transcript_5344/g.11688 Transcript_5344/m.11688 type:complete len:272 (+) Transcript_5344:57-872(+)|eukprot:CAMPEP_0202902524 /NCGR_PEP_ID=MMETSP1392-20130828/16904_1 /ASSEMBLY_ACC=CAM_ASM_000868 /TAXON_ID=225041 /ORGANISM="Chlamydomonas chlamydogama, Strain SAG 11-48b" /LENGTH=271 /DNA_ID=CAMNT_0049589303 /DNA_START=56 /DNA_END=871 /DNA_ORIENTATION=+